MIFSNAIARPVVFSKFSDVFSGFPKVDIPSPITRFDTPKLHGPEGGKTTDGSSNGFDQAFVDKKVSAFGGAGHASGHRTPGDAADTSAPVAPEVAHHRAENAKKWQAQKDAEFRDKLFEQPTEGRVDGKAVEPFSESALVKNVEATAKAKTAKADRALPLQIRNIAKVAVITAVITAPLTAVVTLAANVLLECIKPKINPPPAPATGQPITESRSAGAEQAVTESRLVDNVQRNVFLLANTLGALRSEEGVEPSKEWLTKTNSQRMDCLDEMLDYLEPEFAEEAKALGIPSQAASIGALQDNIEQRAAGMESRMAYLNGLIGAINARLS